MSDLSCCRACKMWHNPRTDCKVAARYGKAWLTKEDALGLVVERALVANTVAEVANADDPVANKHGKYADKEARRRYMREYMAKRRAK